MDDKIIMTDDDLHTAELTRLRQSNAELLGTLDWVVARMNSEESRFPVKEKVKRGRIIAHATKVLARNQMPKPTRAKGREIMKRIERKMAATTPTNSD